MRAVAFIASMLCVAAVARAQPPEIRFDFEPATPTPEMVYQGDTGHFRANVYRDGRRHRITAGVLSTYPGVLMLQREGDRWRWRAIGAGRAAIRVTYEGNTVLSHEMRVLAEPTHHVILRVVRVTPDWHSYVHNGGGWPQAVEVKESESLKYFEAAIWDETRAIHLYEFDNEFEPSLNGRTPEQWVAHRESYRLMQVPGMPLPPHSPEISLFIREAFKDFATYIVSRYPDSGHHLMFHGHGGPGGRLFESQLFYSDANEMLEHWTAALGQPLGVIDMGGPCTKGGFEDLTNFCQHARFYVASDLPNGGYTLDDWTIEKILETEPETQYHRLFAEARRLRDALVGRIDLQRKFYEYSRQNMTESQVMQANYLYSCREFTPFSEQFLAFLDDTRASWSYGDDLLEFLQTNGAGEGLLRAFQRVISHRADNKDFFEWPETRNGVLMPHYLPADLPYWHAKRTGQL